MAMAIAGASTAAAQTDHPGRPVASAGVAGYVQAEQAFQAGDLSRARELYAQLTEQSADQPLAWFRLGLIQQRQQAARAALHAYDQALSQAQTQADAPDTKELLAKIRFNRALLLLEVAAEDLQKIAPQALSRELEVTRAAVQQHLGAALLSAGSRVSLDAPNRVKSVSKSVRAKSYIYTAPPPASAPPAASAASLSRASSGPQHRRALVRQSKESLP